MKSYKELLEAVKDKKAGTGPASCDNGPGKGARFSELSDDQHLECMAFHKSEWNAIKNKTHKYTNELDETGGTEAKLKYHAKMYHKHKEA